MAKDKEQRRTELFRLAAVLYADNNYELSLKSIHRKIVESALLESKDYQQSIHEIIDFIQEAYGILVSEDIVLNAIEDKDKFHQNNKNGNVYIGLTEKRKLHLSNKVVNKTIDHFINEFQKEYSNLKNVKDTIYRFLYELFSTNIESFHKLLNSKSDISSIINLDSSSYTDLEKEIINNFLHWDNVEKNKAIFNISSYALEYCMLTNKDGGTDIRLLDLKNKSFHLDTNIIYRALGINGIDRKKRTKTFLEKFVKAGEVLKISKYTDDEFKKGIEGHIKRIEELDSPRVSSKVYQSIDISKDVFNFYHEWRLGKSNTHLSVFSAYISQLYEELKRKFKIEVDYNVPFSEKEESVKEHIKNYASSIFNFKGKDYPANNTFNKAETDSKNILWIESERKNNNQNIFNTKYFLISSDQCLRRWDYERKTTTPVVILPSQWMSIILRYFDSSADDYKSFVSFLNLPSSEQLITGEQLQAVLNGISEMTTDIGYQQQILNSLVESKFKQVLSSKDTIQNTVLRSSTYAENYLENELEIHKEQLLTHKKAIDKQKKELNSQKEAMNAFSKHLIVSEKEQKRQAEFDQAKLKKEIKQLTNRIKKARNELSILKNELANSISLKKEWTHYAVELVIFIIGLLPIISIGYLLFCKIDFKNISTLFTIGGLVSFFIALIGAYKLYISIREKSYILNKKEIFFASKRKQIEEWKENNTKYNELDDEIRRLEEERDKLLNE